MLEDTLRSKRRAIDALTLDRQRLQLRAQAALLRLMHCHALLELGQLLAARTSSTSGHDVDGERATDSMDGFADFLAAFDDHSPPSTPGITDMASDLASWDLDSDSSESATPTERAVKTQLPPTPRQVPQLPCNVDSPSALNWSPASAAAAAACADLTSSGLAGKICRYLQHSGCLLM